MEKNVEKLELLVQSDDSANKTIAYQLNVGQNILDGIGLIRLSNCPYKIMAMKCINLVGEEYLYAIKPYIGKKNIDFNENHIEFILKNDLKNGFTIFFENHHLEMISYDPKQVEFVFNKIAFAVSTQFTACIWDIAPIAKLVAEIRNILNVVNPYEHYIINKEQPF